MESAGKCPTIARGGGGGRWALLELTDALYGYFGQPVIHFCFHQNGDVVNGVHFSYCLLETLCRF